MFRGTTLWIVTRQELFEKKAMQWGNFFWLGTRQENTDVALLAMSETEIRCRGQ